MPDDSTVSIASDHWLTGVRRVASPNCDDRADPDDISLIILHGISLPPGEFGGGWLNSCSPIDCKWTRRGPMADLVGLRVSSHLLIDRDGLCTQFVPFHRRAWHAGRSAWQGRPGCNDYAVGIELEGTDALPYTEAQYRRLIPMVKTLLATYAGLSPEAIVGHLEVAPERKTDPGPRFDWRRLLLAVI